MVWYGMVWNCIVWYGMVWYCVVLYGMVLCGIIWNCMVWYGMEWNCKLYCVVWYGMVWYGVVWHGVVWHALIMWYSMVSYVMVSNQCFNKFHLPVLITVLPSSGHAEVTLRWTHLCFVIRLTLFARFLQVRRNYDILRVVSVKEITAVVAVVMMLRRLNQGSC